MCSRSTYLQRVQQLPQSAGEAVLIDGVRLEDRLPVYGRRWRELCYSAHDHLRLPDEAGQQQQQVHRVLVACATHTAIGTGLARGCGRARDRRLCAHGKQLNR